MFVWDYLPREIYGSPLRTLGKRMSIHHYLYDNFKGGGCLHEMSDYKFILYCVIYGPKKKNFTYG